MDMSTFEKFESANWSPETIARTRPAPQLAESDEERREIEMERRERKANFPHSVIFEGSFPEYDFANRWCWQNFGPRHGECSESYSEYPACPLVLATGRIENRDGREKKKYGKVDEHSHEGTWTWYFFGKTDYDYGFGEYYFASESDRDRFIAAVPTFSWGENYHP
jgi:hypothetical protein